MHSSTKQINARLKIKNKSACTLWLKRVANLTLIKGCDIVLATDMQSLHNSGIVSQMSFLMCLSCVSKSNMRTIFDAGACQNLMCA